VPRQLFANPLTDAAASPWLDVAERVGDIIRNSIVEREHDNAVPHDLIELLRAHDLLRLVIPTELGGHGEAFGVAADVARILARADGGIAHALGYHYVWLTFVTRYGTDSGRAIVERSAEQNLFWASIGSAFGGSGSIRADGDDGWRVDASRGFATGAPLADVLFTQTVSADDGLLYLSAIPTTRPGVSVSGDWDVIGQKLSASAGITLTDVRVDADDLVNVLPAPGTYPAPLQSLMIPTFQLLFGYLNLGIAEGALLEARDYVRNHGRPWVHASVDRSLDDPYIATLFGEHASRVAGVAAQLREATVLIEALFDGRVEVTPQNRGQLAEIIAAAKVVSQRVGLDATSAVFEATGARSAGRSFGLDRHWRNIRTVSLHDPISYKLAEIGAYVLEGVLPEPSVYR
jgi:alkylation response protein AidB-like acyl-CoA dehydrogenase